MDGGGTFLLFISIAHFFAINGQVIPREALQIIIGGGGGPPSPPPEYQDCPPPPPPPCPPPPPPPPPCPPPISPPPPPPPPPPPSPPPQPKHSPPPPSPPPRPPRPPHRSPTPPTPFIGGFESKLLQKTYKVIQDFKNKITSDPKGITNTWKGNNICRDYKGFICDIVPNSKQKNVAGVNFNNFNITGPITDFLLNLTDIAFFHANSNGLTGTIPNGIKDHPYLYELDLSNNKFSGSFPTAVLGAKKLVFLDLRFNTFSGQVPPQVFQLDLDLLFINNNNFKQTLPATIGITPALYLTLANNYFIGEIPPTIGHASNTLLEVLFLNNKLTGCLPYEIGLLKKTTVFDVGGNSLTGPIPYSFQCLEKMELLNLANNKFSDVVPEAVCSLPNLSNFTLSYNYFTQVGPQCRKLIKTGVLDMKMNCILDLPNQRSAAECRSFYSNPQRCRNEKSFTNIPCGKGYALESSDLQSTAPAPAPGGQTYGALSPH